MKNAIPIEDFGAWCRQQRHRLGLGQTEVEARTGVSQDTISAIETGSRQARSDTICRLAEAFGYRAVLGFEKAA